MLASSIVYGRQPSEPAVPASVIRNGTALVGERLEAVEFEALSLRDGEIVEIVLREPSPQIDQTGRWDEVIDASDCFVVPGLVDAHVHLSLSGGLVPFDTWDGSEQSRRDATEVNGLRCLLNGITAVRDLGCPDASVIAYSRSVDRGSALGPRIAAAGRPIAITGGHIWEYCRVADEVDAAREAAWEQLRDGASVVKLMASGGFSSATDPSAEGLSFAQMEAAVEVAHAENAQVAAHAHSDRSVQNALDAGVDTIEHAAFASRETHLRLRAIGATLVPTLHAVVMASRDGDATSSERLERFRRSVREAVDAGVRVAAGTDAGTQDNPIGGLVDELLAYQAEGMSTYEALRAATVLAGPLVGEGIGIIEPGAHADLLVLGADPRSDLGALRDVRMVIADGKMVDRDAVANELTRRLERAGSL